MLITPERIRWLRREALRRGPAPWSSDLAYTCDVALDARCDAPTTHGGRNEKTGGAGSVGAAEQACAEAVDGWQATGAEGALTREQIEDLRYYATLDHHASVTCAFALTPILHCWQPNRVEIRAAEQCRGAWNARARRLRDAGIDPWPTVQTAAPISLDKRPRRLMRVGRMGPGGEVHPWEEKSAMAIGGIVMHVRVGAFTNRWLSVVVERPDGSLIELGSESQITAELVLHGVPRADEIASDTASLIWGELAWGGPA